MSQTNWPIYQNRCEQAQFIYFCFNGSKLLKTAYISSPLSAAPLTFFSPKSQVGVLLHLRCATETRHRGELPLRPNPFLPNPLGPAPLDPKVILAFGSIPLRPKPIWANATCDKTHLRPMPLRPWPIWANNTWAKPIWANATWAKTHLGQDIIMHQTTIMDCRRNPYSYEIIITQWFFGRYWSLEM